MEGSSLTQVVAGLQTDGPADLVGLVVPVTVPASASHGRHPALRLAVPGPGDTSSAASQSDTPGEQVAAGGHWTST